MNRQKDIERIYLDEARRASSIFPAHEPIPHERPDFLLGTLGIEVTELCEEAPRAEGGRLGKVAPKAKLLYSRRPGAKPVNVSPVLSREADDMRVDDLASGLADFVYQHRDANGTFRWDKCADVPKGYSQIGVFAPLPGEPAGP